MPVPDSTDHLAEEAERLLAGSDLVLVGRLPWSSNATFLCELWPAGSRPDGGLPVDDGASGGPDTAADPSASPIGRAVYKPHRGERPLWDFPDGLYRREVAAYRLARALTWDVVPPTIERDGPLGIGSVQAFVDADFERHYFDFVEDPVLHDQLRRLAAFDLVANSTDRKGGHVLIDADDHLWGIDNGLCLHAEFKVRTVIWDFAGDPVDSALADDLYRFANSPLPADLAELIDPFERDAVQARARGLLAEGRLPSDPTGRRHPWPLV